ncbi:hypothetical protein ASG51_06730 [Methylobacterium sp. Leaf465]|uniref:hypothetical protein n=1 Tax=Methylobacterium sp. Leaf465 TaxID=1736385 RepID=UPI0006FBE115|nr:hypothetical protein [Methylobacterium sp. Leaf465]KQT76569.1 hypothetical protein ASG51_06730 [Methylobacterium sp. Leaf465]
MPVPPRPRHRARPAALAVLLLVFLVPTDGQAARSRTARVAEPAAPVTSWTSSEPENPTCQRTRRKLWQADEGWVVRSITVCR